MTKNLQVAIDGPAGSGKSTVAKAIAKHLGLLYIDSGAMYRVLTLKALSSKIPLDQEDLIAQLACETDIRLDHSEARRVFCDGIEVTTEIRSPEVSRSVSRIALYPAVRKRLVELQRLEAKRGSVIMDGRDIGTYVLPDAHLKIFLTATLEERSHRRWLELSNTGKNITLEQVKTDIEQRDRIDLEREHNPLEPATDAVIIDTTGLGVEEIVNKILAMINDQKVG